MGGPFRRTYRSLVIPLAVMATFSVQGFSFAYASSSQITATQAETIARNAFSISNKYTVANESYQNSVVSQNHPSYTITFQNSNTSDANDSIFVTVDAVTGLVTDYSHYAPNLTFQFPVPESAAAAAKVAIQYAKQLYPTQYPLTQMHMRPSVMTDLRGPVSYEFDFERMENGIPAPFDGFSITVDEQGNIQSVHDAWTNQPFPTAKPTIPTSVANQVYTQALGLHAEYDAVYHADGTNNIALEYVPASTSEQGGWNQQFDVDQANLSVAIDASTGKWLLPTGATQTPKADTAPQPLDTSEIQNPVGSKAVNWSEAQSLQFAVQTFGLKAKSLQSENEWFGPNHDTSWNFAFSSNDSNPSSTQSNTVNVTVDATYGYISSYSVNQPDTSAGNNTKMLSSATLLSDAQTLVKKVFPGHLDNLSVVPQSTSGASSDNAPNSMFTLQSIVNGVPDGTSNGYLQLDPSTGALIYLNESPSTLGATYPSPSNAVSLAVANQAYVHANPLQLEYVLTQPNQTGATSSAQPEVKLAYVPEPATGKSQYFDAIKGAFVADDAMDYQPYTGTIRDIASSPAAADLQLLASAGLLPVDASGDMHPNQTISTASFMKLVMDALGTVNHFSEAKATTASIATAIQGVATTNPAYRALVTAYELGWLDPTHPLNPTAPITRDEAAHIFADALGYQALLSSPSLFSLSASDASSISQDAYAADAIVTGLGILPLRSGAFDGSAPLTVAEAAQGVVATATHMGPISVIMPLATHG